MLSIRPLRIAAGTTIALLALAAPMHGARAQALPSASALLAKHDAAVGGRAAMDKHTSVHETVTASVGAGTVVGTVEVFHAKPNLYLQKTTLPNGVLVSGFDGKTAWSVVPGQGAQLADSATTAGLKEQADFFGDYYDASRVKSAETIEVADFEGQRCYKVKIVHKDNSETTMFLDSATGLRAGQMQTMPMNGQQMQVTLTMSDYKDYGGIKLPTKRVQKLPMGEVTLQIQAVEFDNVDPSTFALPDAVKALVKP
jgi:outer membrane lipoprotein-sorting protein